MKVYRKTNPSGGDLIVGKNADCPDCKSVIMKLKDLPVSDPTRKYISGDNYKFDNTSFVLGTDNVVGGFKCTIDQVYPNGIMITSYGSSIIPEASVAVGCNIILTSRVSEGLYMPTEITAATMVSPTQYYLEVTTMGTYVDRYVSGKNSKYADYIVLLNSQTAGSDNIALGLHNLVYGQDNYASGVNNQVSGDNNKCNGSGNFIKGSSNFVTGDDNKVEASNVKIYGSGVTCDIDNVTVIGDGYSVPEKIQLSPGKGVLTKGSVIILSRNASSPSTIHSKHSYDETSGNLVITDNTEVITLDNVRCSHSTMTLTSPYVIDASVSKSWKLVVSSSTTPSIINLLNSNNVVLVVENGGTDLTFDNSWVSHGDIPTLQTSGVDIFEIYKHNDIIFYRHVGAKTGT